MLRRVFCLILLIVLSSCWRDDTKDMSENLGLFELQKSDFASLNGWNDERIDTFQVALNDVCQVLLKKTQQKLQSEVLEISLGTYQNHCKKILEITNQTKLKNYIEDNFVPYLVKYKGSEAGKFTSYYEAELKASYQKGGEYQYPIYGKPKDLVEINLRDFDASLPNQRLVGRVKDGKLVKYYTRKEVDEGKLDAPIILWGNDQIDIYVMQIQGSAVATLPDGKQIRVGYADNNGHPFRGIGSILLENGLIKSQEASMPKIKQWLKSNGETAKKNMLLNDRYIFHKIVEAKGPIGAMGLPLVAGRSMAVDKEFIPLGAIMWLETKGPDGEYIRKLVMAEDVGGAIKGGVRGDYFWGHGEEALDCAGRMNSQGKYFILLPKDAEVKVNGRR